MKKKTMKPAFMAAKAAKASKALGKDVDVSVPAKKKGKK